MLIRDENGDPYCLKYCKEVKHRELCVIYCEHYDSLRSTIRLELDGEPNESMSSLSKFASIKEKEE